MKAPRILVADDHEFVRRGLIRILLARHPDWEIVGEASNGLDAIRLAESTRPDIAILDLSMPEQNGLQVTERLHERVPSIKTLILTMHTGEQIVRNLMKAGASAYMVKSDASSKLVEAVERLAAGHTFFASPAAVNESGRASAGAVHSECARGRRTASARLRKEQQADRDGAETERKNH